MYVKQVPMVADAAGVTGETLSSDLTPAQRRFAESVGAVPTRRSEADPELVVMYREVEGVTFRWIIDRVGTVVDATTFRESD